MLPTMETLIDTEPLQVLSETSKETNLFFTCESYLNPEKLGFFFF